MSRYPITEPSNARSPEYREHLEKIRESGLCPFCPGGDTYEQQERILENESWIATRNYVPLKNTAHHFMLVPKRHLEERGELSESEVLALFRLESELKKAHAITGSALYGRDGNPLLTGATVAHLHFHLIAPEGFVQVSFGPYSPQG